MKQLDGARSDKSREWLEKSYLEMEKFGRIHCPGCFNESLTIMDIKCPNCGLMIAKNRQAIDKDGQEKLAGGLTAAELMKRAEKWWNNKMRKYFKRVRARRGDSIARTPALKYGNGILMGKHFDDLTRGEKFSVCKAYHQAWYVEHVEHSKPDVAAIII